ncbi:MAG TPA: VIT family protein [Rudaea sp.]|jgi:VIT1/CCC1 family predicted Fe2+/Mn2+ transporter|nr:VIT family protein [Rudaea sp.]
MPRRHHREHHLTQRVGWLRAAVLGANDGVVSTASLIVGVASANSTQAAIITAGLASLVAGGMSMAAGEYVSVSSQADLESAAVEVERRELAEDHAGEKKELANIYVKRGLSKQLASDVADQLMEHDALDAHLRDELGITDKTKPRPLQAAFASAISYTSGAALPLLTVFIAPQGWLTACVAAVSLIVLTVLGAVAARTGGANLTIGALRVLIWGSLAMAITAGLGKVFGALA